MDFFQHQDRARRRTSLLVVYFLMAVATIIVSVYLAVAAVLFYGQNQGGQGASGTLWFPDVFAAVSLGTIFVITVGSLYKIAELSSGGEGVARSLGGRPVQANTTDLRERVLLNVVEEMAIAAGTPVPPVFLLDNESAINAFAAGTTPQNAVIGITRGSIDTLKRDELQGVIAHEFSHILNGDMRLNIRLIGILNGILLIAMIGYFLMRTGGASANYSNSSSSDNKRGGNPLPLLGICLFAIGYIGIFFGNLIKSAVSRQREFLADASAVQFTRLPDGIEGALKKIGGLIYGSRLKTARAEEASHMFFGNGLRQPFLELLATHPPLAERIRRIDPKFDGKFPEVTQISYSNADLVDAGTLAARRGEVLGVHAAAVAGAQSFASEPAGAVAQIGAPRVEHLDYATALVSSLPPELTRTLRDPLGAIATVYALLLDDERPDVRQTQLEYLASQADPRAREETLRIAPFAAKVPAETKLPLVSMVLPALKALSPGQLASFHDDVEFLIKADNKVSLFEYAVHRLVLKRLLPRLERKPPKDVRYNSLEPLVPACNGLLSTLAYSGTRDANQAAQAFQLGAAQLRSGAKTVKLLPQDQAGLKAVDSALDQLAGAAPMVKKQVLEACAACICADGKVTIEEGELLRVISDALDCPMPPLLAAPA
jgi:Zn-dependent protease with chaperone function